MAAARKPPFKVSWSQAISTQAAALGERALQRGLGRTFLEDLKLMEDRLATEPLSWGDPKFNYHHLDLTVYLAFMTLSQVHYAVDPVRRIVCIKDISPLPGQALDS